MHAHAEKQSFIGKTLRVLSATNESLIGKEGIIVDETKNTFVLETDGKQWVLPKDIGVFNIAGEKIDGKRINKTIWERIKA
ncbi:MAG: ribonuclease P protein subunit [Candidatus Woesearchaeota archaeon]|nr:MAG: ribonuclease P protein subunit [Candidatus Woesearchaeota archaeon]